MSRHEAGDMPLEALKAPLANRLLRAAPFTLVAASVHAAIWFAAGQGLGLWFWLQESAVAGLSCWAMSESHFSVLEIRPEGFRLKIFQWQQFAWDDVESSRIIPLPSWGLFGPPVERVVFILSPPVRPHYGLREQSDGRPFDVLIPECYGLTAAELKGRLEARRAGRVLEADPGGGRVRLDESTDMISRTAGSPAGELD